MSEKRRRDQCEYLREYKRKKKEKEMMSKRERLERYYMGKEDVDVVAATQDLTVGIPIQLVNPAYLLIE